MPAAQPAAPPIAVAAGRDGLDAAKAVPESLKRADAAGNAVVAEASRRPGGGGKHRRCRCSGAGRGAAAAPAPAPPRPGGMPLSSRPRCRMPACQRRARPAHQGKQAGHGRQRVQGRGRAAGAVPPAVTSTQSFAGNPAESAARAAAPALSRAHSWTLAPTPVPLPPLQRGCRRRRRRRHRAAARPARGGRRCAGCGWPHRAAACRARAQARGGARPVGGGRGSGAHRPRRPDAARGGAAIGRRRDRDAAGDALIARPASPPARPAARRGGTIPRFRRIPATAAWRSRISGRTAQACRLLRG